MSVLVYTLCIYNISALLKTMATRCSVVHLSRTSVFTQRNTNTTSLTGAPSKRVVPVTFDMSNADVIATNIEISFVTRSDSDVSSVLLLTIDACHTPGKMHATSRARYRIQYVIFVEGTPKRTRL